MEEERNSRKAAELSYENISNQQSALSEELSSQKDTLSTVSDFLHSANTSAIPSRRVSYLYNSEGQVGVNRLVKNYKYITNIYNMISSTDPIKLQELLHENELILEKERNDAKHMKMELQNHINNYCKETHEIRKLLKCEIVSEKHIDYCQYLINKSLNNNKLLEENEEKIKELEEENKNCKDEIKKLKEEKNKIEKENLQLSNNNNNKYEELLNIYNNLEEENEKVVNDYNLLHDKYENNKRKNNDLVKQQKEMNQEMENIINENTLINVLIYIYIYIFYYLFIFIERIKRIRRRK